MGQRQNRSWAPNAASSCTSTLLKTKLFIINRDGLEWLQKAFKDAAFLYIDYTVPKLVLKRNPPSLPTRLMLSATMSKQLDLNSAAGHPSLKHVYRS